VEFFELRYRFDCSTMKLSKSTTKTSKSSHGLRFKYAQKFAFGKNWKLLDWFCFFHMQWDVGVCSTAFTVYHLLLPLKKTFVLRFKLRIQCSCCCASAGARSWLAVTLVWTNFWRMTSKRVLICSVDKCLILWTIVDFFGDQKRLL